MLDLHCLPRIRSRLAGAQHRQLEEEAVHTEAFYQMAEEKRGKERQRGREERRGRSRDKLSLITPQQHHLHASLCPALMLTG